MRLHPPGCRLLGHNSAPPVTVPLPVNADAKQLTLLPSLSKRSERQGEGRDIVAGRGSMLCGYRKVGGWSEP